MKSKMTKELEDKSEFKGKVHKKFGPCADYAENFMKTVIQVNTPMALADVFMQNSYLKADMNGSARIFNSALDYSTFRSGIYHIAEDRKLLSDIYTFAFFDYAKKHNLMTGKEADEMARKEVELK
jgi:hypothetical protein